MPIEGAAGPGGEDFSARQPSANTATKTTRTFAGFILNFVPAPILERAFARDSYDALSSESGIGFGSRNAGIAFEFQYKTLDQAYVKSAKQDHRLR